MSLGIFDRLFTLLEGECKRLDVAMASAKSGGGVGGESFQRYTAALKHLATLKEQHGLEEQRANLYTQLATHFALTLPEPEQNPTLQQLRQESATAKRNLASLVNRNCTLKTQGT